jgi:hypothetical protein
MTLHGDSTSPSKPDSRGFLCRSDTGCTRGTGGAAFDSHSSKLAVLLAIALSHLCGACGTQATIVLKSGDQVKGRILEKRGAVLVARNEEQGTYGVPDYEVQEVRHPGKGAMIAGGVLAGVGAVLLAAGALKECSDENDESYFDECEFGRGMSLLFGTAGSITGVSIGAYGFAVHESSKARAGRQRELGPESSHAEVRGIGLVADF